MIRRKLRDATVDGASPLEYPENLVNDLEPAVRSLRPAVEDALSTADAGALAREVAELDAAAVTRVRGLFSSIGSTGPAEQGAEMARLGLATF